MCEVRCVCENFPAATDANAVDLRHAHVPSTCVTTRDALKKAKYNHVCRLLEVEARRECRPSADCAIHILTLDSVPYGIPPHTGEKLRRDRRPIAQVVDEIGCEARTIAGKQNTALETRIWELSGIVRQFVELLELKAICLPDSLFLRIKTHAPETFEPIDRSLSIAKSQSKRPATPISQSNCQVSPVDRPSMAGLFPQQPLALLPGAEEQSFSNDINPSVLQWSNDFWGNL